MLNLAINIKIQYNVYVNNHYMCLFVHVELTIFQEVFLIKNALKRSFKEGECVYVVDYWGTENGTQAFKAKAEILKVDVKAKTFIAVLYGDTYQKYSFNDYSRLIFDTSAETVKAAGALPKPETTVYQIIDKRVYKKLVKDIGGQYIDGTFDLVIYLNKGKDVSTKEIGHSLFINELDARK